MTTHETILATGAACDIGRETARRFISLGWQMAAVILNAPALQKLIAKLGGKVSPIIGDVSAHEGARAISWLPGVVIRAFVVRIFALLGLLTSMLASAGTPSISLVPGWNLVGNGVEAPIAQAADMAWISSVQIDSFTPE